MKYKTRNKRHGTIDNKFEFFFKLPNFQIFNLLLLFIPFFMASCESLVTEVSPKNLNIPESKLVLTCFISPQDTVIYATLTESNSLFSKKNIKDDSFYVFGNDTTWMYNNTIKNAKIGLSDGKQEVLFRYNDTSQVYYLPLDKTNFKILAGKTYTISAEDATRKVSGTCTVPNTKPTIGSYEIKNDTSLVSWQKGVRSRVVNVKLNWQDANKPNTYYRLAGKARAAVTQLYYNIGIGGVIQVDTLKIRRDTLVYNIYWDKDKLMTNKNLEGTKFSETGNIHLGFSHAVDGFSGSKGKAIEKPVVFDMEVALFEVEENYYIYHRTLQDNARNEGNPFSEPTPSFTNIKNGLGCFGASNKAISIIQKEKLPKF